MKIFKYLVLILLFQLISNGNTWEKIPIPEYINKKTKSPWNFIEDFESQKEGTLKLKNLSINDKGKGLKPFKIKKDTNGNKYLEVTVQHEWNNDPYKSKKNSTERAEFQTRQKRALNKDIWIGFKVRVPKDFEHIDTRVLFFQFKNQFDPMRKSPLLGIRFYENGNAMVIGGDTGGSAGKSWNKEDYKKYSLRYKYLKKNGNWIMFQGKERNMSPIKLSKCVFGAKKDSITGEKYISKSNKKQNINNNNCFGCYEYFTRKVCCYDAEGNPIWKDPLYVNSKSISNKCEKFNNFKKNFKATKLGDWTTYKIGIKNSKKQDGYVKIFKDNKLIVNYSGITYEWKGNYTGSYARIGIYRNSGRRIDIKYPSQSIHFDDFIVVSDKKTLDNFLK